MALTAVMWKRVLAEIVLVKYCYAKFRIKVLIFVIGEMQKVDH